MRFSRFRAESGGHPVLARELAGALLLSMSLCLLLPSASTVAAGSATGKPAWNASIVVPGTFTGLTSVHGSLYAVKYASHGPLSRGSRIVRISPTSGKFLAQSPTLPGAGSPIYVDDAIWVSSVTFFSADATSEGPAVLVRLNPLSLRVETRVRTKYMGYPTIVGGPKGLLWGEWRSQSSCTLRRIDPVSGVVVVRDQLRLSSGSCDGAALDSTGSYLYVSIDRGALGMAVYKVDGKTGAVISHIDVGEAGLSVSMVAVRGHLWIAEGDPGTNGVLLFLAISPLRLLAESSLMDGNGGSTNLGPGGYTLPTFGQFPSVDYSGGIVWVGSDSGLACFAPSSRRTLAYVLQRYSPIITDSFVRVGRSVWVNANFAQPGTGLARVDPPAACVS